MTEKGKNFSANNTTDKRKQTDFYETPYSLTRKFLDVEEFDKSLSVCEPACGKGAITKVLNEYWVTSWSIGWLLKAKIFQKLSHM